MLRTQHLRTNFRIITSFLLDLVQQQDSCLTPTRSSFGPEISRLVTIMAVRVAQTNEQILSDSSLFVFEEISYKNYFPIYTLSPFLSLSLSLSISLKAEARCANSRLFINVSLSLSLSLSLYETAHPVTLSPNWHIWPTCTTTFDLWSEKKREPKRKSFDRECFTNFGLWL